MSVHSIRIRLTAWYCVVLAAVLVAAGIISFGVMKRQLRRDVDSALAATSRQIAATLRDEVDEHHGLLPQRAVDEVLGEFRDKEHPVFLWSAAATPPPGFKTSDHIRFNVTRLHLGHSDYVLASGQSTTAQEEMLAELRRAMLLTIPLALLIAAGGGYLLAHKSLEPVEEAFASQRRFMAEASHELRTPVAILQGELEVTLSRDDRDARDYRESLQIMEKSVRRLTRIVRDLFLLARGDAGQYPLRDERFYLDEVVAQTVHGLRTLAADCGVAVHEEHEPDLAVRGDEDLVQRMIANLVENAIKNARAEVTVRCVARDGERRIEVRDDGRGVAPELRGKIFERFIHAGGAGAGLGLPIARWIAEAHGGRVWLERSDDSGTLFCAALPAVTATAR
ncbi:MAG TPA: HAMP domain-containing sensor histidine kinase [Thermoanaerobaculia bacterium]|nr:HAMP domain-containing sensor histidine kinase [Thermoanaerobaculia bacterium]